VARWPEEKPWRQGSYSFWTWNSVSSTDRKIDGDGFLKLGRGAFLGLVGGKERDKVRTLRLCILY
jgi:hypothetical protein